MHLVPWLTPFGVAFLRQALVFGNPTRERGTESRLIVPRLRVGLPEMRNSKTRQCGIRVVPRPRVALPK